MNDREWDIFVMEIEARNEALIGEFLSSKMRPRDLEQLIQTTEQPLAEQPLEEQNG
jgi:hypothetical protein